MANRIKALFTDVGGVILTNGWDRHMRKEAVERFHLNAEEVDKRHDLMFGIYEIGKITLDDYLNHVIFYEPRSFTLQIFKEFMFDQSQPLQPMYDYMSQFKTNYSLPVVAISNEGLELMLHRIKTFNLKKFIDFFLCSCFVHMRKPDPGIFQLALDTAQVKAEEVIYIDDRLLLVEIAESFGMHGIHHTDIEKTRSEIEKLI